MKFPLLQLHILTTAKLSEIKDLAASQAKSDESKESNGLIARLLYRNHQLRKAIAPFLRKRN